MSCFYEPSKLYPDWARPKRSKPLLGARPLQRLTTPQLERFAKRKGIDVSAFTRKDPEHIRRDQLIKAVLEKQKWEDRSIRYDLAEMLQAGRVARQVLEDADQINMDEVLQRVQQVADEAPPAEEARKKVLRPADPEVIERFRKALEQTKDLRDRVDARQSQLRKQKEVALKDLQRRYAEKIREGTAREQDLLQRQIGVMRQALGLDDIDAGTEGLLSDEDIEQLMGHLRTHELMRTESASRVAGQLIDFANFLRFGMMPKPFEVELYGRVFGQGVARAIASHYTRMDRFKQGVIEVLTSSRTLVASYDFSAVLRQGFSTLLTHPRMSGHGFVEMMKAVSGEGQSRRIWERMKNDKFFEIAEEMNLFLVNPTSELLRPEVTEEAFMGRFFQKVAETPLRQILGDRNFARAGTRLIAKAIGLGVRPMERAYLTYLNFIRFNLFKRMAMELMEAGFDPADRRDKQHFREAAKFINSATGRGNTNLFRGALTNSIFFSPRFVISRFEHIFWRLPKNVLKPPRRPSGGVKKVKLEAVRKEAIRQMVSKTALWTTIALLIQHAADVFDEDVKMETDPRSSDFLKLIIDGKTRVDLAAGYGSAMRLVSSIGDGVVPWDGEAAPWNRKARIKSLRTGKLEETVSPVLAGFFLKGKLSPVPSAFVSVTDGQTWDKEVPTPWRMMREMIAPISLQTLEEVSREHGIRGGAMLMGAEVFGLGVNVFDPEQEGLRDPEPTEIEKYIGIEGRKSTFEDNLRLNLEAPDELKVRLTLGDN